MEDLTSLEPMLVSLTEAPEWIKKAMSTTTNMDISHNLKQLTTQCARFKEDFGIQRNGGLNEDTWIKWCYLLVKSCGIETALNFSQTSTKHNQNSEYRIQKINSSSSSGLVRCSKFGCDKNHVNACFSGEIRRNSDLEITNSPGSLVKSSSQLKTVPTTNSSFLATIGIIVDKETGEFKSLNENLFVQHLVRDKLKILYCRDHFYLYDHNVWKCNDTNDISRLIRDVLHSYKPNTWTLGLETKYLSALRLEAPRVKEMDTDRSKLNLENGMVNLNTFELIPHSSSYYSTVQLPIKYDPKATCPTFMDFLDTIYFSDQQLIALTAEMFGYCLTAEVRAQKAFILYGKGSNGKSVIADVLKRLCGKANVTSISLNDLDKSFARFELVDKLLNLATENEVSSKGMNTQYFKAIVSGDPIRVEQKNETGFMYEPFCKLVFALNNLPYTKDKSNGFVRRLVPIPFNRHFSENEADVNLIDKLILELPGILNFALEGLRRLKANGYVFTNAKASKDLLDSYRKEINPVEEFVDEMIVKGTSEDRVFNKKLGDVFRTWCLEEGHTSLSQYTQKRLVQNIKDILKMKGIEVEMIKSNGLRGLTGIQLKSLAHSQRVGAFSPIETNDIFDM